MPTHLVWVLPVFMGGRGGGGGVLREGLLLQLEQMTHCRCLSSSDLPG